MVIHWQWNTQEWALILARGTLLPISGISSLIAASARLAACASFPLRLHSDNLASGCDSVIDAADFGSPWPNR